MKQAARAVRAGAIASKTGTPRRALRVPCALAALAFLAAAPARAAGPSLSISVSRDPTEGTPIRVTLTGTTPGPDMYGLSQYLARADVRPAGGAPCGAPPTAAVVGQNVGGIYLDPAPATFSGSKLFSPAGTDLSAGRWLVCASLSDDQTFGADLADAQVTFTVRRPRERLAISAPRHERAGGRYHYVVRVSSEADDRTLDVRVYWRRYMRRCPSSVQRAPDVPFTDYLVDGRSLRRGALTLRPRIRFVGWGRRYLPASMLVCGWITQNSHGRTEATSRAGVTLLAARRRR